MLRIDIAGWSTIFTVDSELKIVTATMTVPTLFQQDTMHLVTYPVSLLIGSRMGRVYGGGVEIGTMFMWSLLYIDENVIRELNGAGNVAPLNQIITLESKNSELAIYQYYNARYSEIRLMLTRQPTII
jgi:hypothetical protein